MNKYQPNKIEAKWQKKWTENNIYRTEEDCSKPKYYVLDMFPYPSGDGLHVGHPKGYIATDIFSRHKRMQGNNVLHPMGWDAFGLPAENYAIKNKKHPRVATEQNISTFKSQLLKLGFSYDWEREIDTTDPKFYKWTQWIFLQLFKKGLAYESHEPINWCPSCKTGLANEDLEDGKCERCDSEIEQKPMRQWVLAIRKYADRMLLDLDKLPDWEDSIKEMQRNWIGRSEGARVKFKVRSEKSEASLSSPASDSEGRGSHEEEVEVFTTRPDTLFGATYFVISPEHPLINNCELSITNYEEVVDYVEKARKKTELERTDLAKEKTGVELKGIKAVNPVNGEEIPVWVADYVMMGYGTGAIMAVPAHDSRDYEFAIKYDLPIIQVVAPLYEGENENSLQENKEMKTRKAVDVILKHWKNDEYYCLDWSKSGNNWKSIIIGGIEEGETLEEAALRETKEETGYQDMRVIKKIGGEIHSSFFAAHKDINRYSIRNCVYIELLDDEYIKPDEKHIKNHYGKWMPKDTILDYITIVEQKEYLKELFGEAAIFSGDGVAINSDFLNNLRTSEAKKRIIDWLEEKGLGHKDVNYKIQDWVFSRQRYWGEPIPIVHCEKCGVVGVPEKDLPVLLPEVESYEPSGTGESPLVNISDWVNTTCPDCSGPAKRETNTMPQWAGSSWYYLRYIDPNNDEALIDKDKDKYWSPVDFYVGGAEHATRHLIYARFWHKFLYDIGVVNYDEPFKRLQHVGLIQAEDGRKMSKRWGNVINPDSVVESHGADAMRVYEMFMGPFSQACAWSTSGLTGTRKFLEKVWNLQDKIEEGNSSKEIKSLLHKTIKKVGEDIEDFKLNTAVSAMMILANAMEKTPTAVSKEDYKLFILILSPFAPHMSEEIWHEYFGEEKSIVLESWPVYDKELIKDETTKIAIQVNGKLRDTLEVPAETDEEQIKKLAQESEKVKKWTEGKEPKKVIYVKGKLVSIVI